MKYLLSIILVASITVVICYFLFIQDCEEEKENNNKQIEGDSENEAKYNRDWQELQMLKNVLELVSGRVKEITQRDDPFPGMGHLGNSMAEVNYFYRVTRDNPWATTVCEVGFNAGHSFMTFLLGNGKIRYIAFDSGGVVWTEPMIALYQKSFPGQLTYVKGYSTDTVKNFKEEGFTGCDVISIDGAHDDFTPYSDATDFLKIARLGAILLMDDYSNDFPGVKKAWHRLVDEKVVQPIKCVEETKCWCHGIYLKGSFPPNPHNPAFNNSTQPNIPQHTQ